MQQDTDPEVIYRYELFLESEPEHLQATCGCEVEMSDCTRLRYGGDLRECAVVYGHRANAVLRLQSDRGGT